MTDEKQSLTPPHPKGWLRRTIGRLFPPVPTLATPQAGKWEQDRYPVSQPAATGAITDEGEAATRAYATELLKKLLDRPDADFREGQWEAIWQLVHHRRRLLVVQRTGWGKSLVYFMATHLLRRRGGGITVMISPLLALMRNQMEAAEALGVSALTVKSGNAEDWPRITSLVLQNQVDVLLISPERLANDRFMTDLLQPIAARLGLFVVDEAHCISDWGHDFRPDYRRIVRVLQAMPPNMPIVATTATANDRVVTDIQEQLGDDLVVVRGPLQRESLALQTLTLPSRAARMAWLARHLPTLPGTGIIYVLTKRDAETLARWLSAKGMAVAAYHSDLEEGAKWKLEHALLGNQLKALVATVALGMGFDKPDLGFVIHFQRPGSVVHYYQQVGRAGRGVAHAHGILLSGDGDQDILDYFNRTAFPPLAHEQAVLDALGEADDGSTITDLEREINLSQGQIEKVLRRLASEHPSPISRLKSRYYLTAIRYVPDRTKAEALIVLRAREQQVMVDYVGTSLCLGQFLSDELSDPRSGPCGKCANCLGELLVPADYPEELAIDAVKFLKQGAIVIEPRKQWPGAVAIPKAQRAEAGCALARWGDGGWGDRIREGKQDKDHFSDDLVEAMALMIARDWKPTPAPQWVTCVPSLNNPTLVPDFARRLAERLGLPFVNCVSKVKNTAPQKQMENSAHQVANLHGAFAVDCEQCLSGPVLLVDDLVDSRWTFTILAAQLRQSGSGPVYPVALASTSKG